MSARGLAAAMGLVALASSDYGSSKHRPARIVTRTKREKAYRVHANRRRKLALASKRRNWGAR